MKKLYKVTQSIMGADKPVDLYFKSKKEADEYYNNHEYCDKPESESVEDYKVDDLLENTNYYM